MNAIVDAWNQDGTYQFPLAFNWLKNSLNTVSLNISGELSVYQFIYICASKTTIYRLVI